MTPLLAQFLAESREFLQSIGDLLLQLEKTPDDSELLNDLFRSVHTLKGNSGLFEFPDMTRVLHAGEDLMVAVRDGRLAYSQALADALLDAMDFIVALCDQIARTQTLGPDYVVTANHHVSQLRSFIPVAVVQQKGGPVEAVPAAAQALITSATHAAPSAFLIFNGFKPTARQAAFSCLVNNESIFWLRYEPIAECFFQGDDPLHIVGQLPGVIARRVQPLKPWPSLAEIDVFQSNLHYQILTTASQAQLIEYLRFVPDQYHLQPLTLADCVAPELNALNEAERAAVETIYCALAAGQPLPDSANPAALFNRRPWQDFCGWLDFWLQLAQQNKTQVANWLLLAGRAYGYSWAAADCLNISSGLNANAAENKEVNKVKPVGGSETGDGLQHNPSNYPGITGADETANFNSANNFAGISEEDQSALLMILTHQRQIIAQVDDVPWWPGRLASVVTVLRSCCMALKHEQGLLDLAQAASTAQASRNLLPLNTWLDTFSAWVRTLHPQVPGEQPETLDQAEAQPTKQVEVAAPEREGDEARLVKRGEESQTLRSLKVDQGKIDRLMNLIGELIVAKNGMPYLANRAEEIFGVRELGREIKTHHSVINRIAEEMQDAIMQIRMMPFSTISSRYPRLVRDISRKLAKDVHFIVEGEDTEADKNIIESLADPLVHILRNSLDHGIESPAERVQAGKPAQATLRLRASQEADKVVILVSDDGRGIDPEKIKRKAYEKGLIDETALERLSEREAIHLIFAAGFSTAEVVSDLSGRGVGMDVVRSAVEKVNGTIAIDSQVGRGTRISIALPLSMAVTRVMLIETDKQLFAIPMDEVVETVRVAKSQIHRVKQHQTTLLRGRIVPLCHLHNLLQLAAEPVANADEELAVLVVRVGEEVIGVVVDNFHGTVDVIQKPLEGVLANLPGYSGSALLGDGSVLMVLNIRELVP